MALDRAKLTKLLALTQSDMNHEALGAVRAANRMLAAEKLTWEQVLAQPEPNVKISISREPFKAEENWVAPHLRDKVMIDLMFKSIYSQPRTGNEEFWRFLDDVHHKFGVYGSLTQGQYNAIRNCYRRTLKTA